MVETLREQVENRVKGLVVHINDPSVPFDYGAYNVSTVAVRQVFPWLRPLIGDEFLPGDHLARVVLHAAERRTEVVRKGILPCRSKEQEVPGYREVQIILPDTKGKPGHTFNFGWRLVNGEEGRFFLRSTELPVTEDQLVGLSALLQDHLQEITEKP